MTQTPTLRLAHFNPDLQSKEDMKRGFIARQNLLNRMLDDLRRETGQSAPQHKLIVGQRGMGKTSLLRRFRYAVEDDAELGGLWLPLVFPEEQYNIARLSDFWLNCLDALGDALEEGGDETLAKRIDALRDNLPKDETQRSAAALGLLLEQSQALNKRLILLIDNLDIVLERLSAQDWEIRRIMSSEPRLLLIGATSRAIPTAYEYGRAFYDFFRVHELKGLSEQETRDVLRQLSELRGQPQVAKILDTAPGRIHALHELSGGNPRTVVLLYEVLETGFDGDARHDLERLLDLYTPLYKARFEEFAPQAQQVIDALAIHWDPMLAGQLAEAMRVGVNTASAQLTRLYEQGMVEKVALFDEKKQGFQIAERFFNIWYLMRASRRVRRRLVWLVRFMETWLEESELNEQARLHSNHESDDGTRERHAEYSFALAQAESLSRRLTETFPEDAPGWLLLAEVEAKQNKTEQALSDLNRWLSLKAAQDEAAEAWQGLSGALGLFRELLQAGHAADLLKQLEQTGLNERWRPLYEAVKAAQAGTAKYLTRVAPEVRRPALDILKTLAPGLVEDNQTEDSICATPH